jgi:hypothetical protein
VYGYTGTGVDACCSQQTIPFVPID